MFNDISDLNRIFMRLQFEYGVELKERKSVIIFDEVQLAPKVRQAIKYFVKDGIYDNVPLIWKRHLPCAHVGRGMRCMRSANIISLYFIASQCVMDRYCSCSASWGRVHEHALFIMHWYSLEYRNVVFVLRDWVPGKYMFVHKNGPFRGCNPGNCNAVHVFLHIVDGAGREWMAPECMWVRAKHEKGG